MCHLEQYQRQYDVNIYFHKDFRTLNTYNDCKTLDFIFIFIRE